MANEVIGIEVQVKLEQLRAQLATLGPGMEKEAKAMTAALNREIKQQTAAMKAAAKATSQVRTDSIKDVAAATEAAGTKFDKLAKAAGPLGGVLARISPEAGEVASSLAGLTSAAEGVAAGLGVSFAAAGAAVAVVTAALGVGLVAWTAYNNEAQRQADFTRVLAEGADRVRTSAERAREAQSDLQETTGTLTLAQVKKRIADEEEAKFYTEFSEQRSKQTALSAKAADQESRGRLKLAAATREQLAEVEAVLARGREEVALIIARRQAKAEYLDELGKSEAALADKEEKRRETDAAADKAAASGAAAEAKRAADKAKADKEAEEAAKRVLANQTARDDAMQASNAKALKRAEEQKKKDQELEDQRRGNHEAELARIAAEQEAAMAATQVRLATASAVAASIEGLTTQLNDQQLDSIDTTSKAGKRAALQQWEQNKAAAFAMATVQAALAIAVANASAPPPFNIPAIIQSTVAGAAAVASVVAAPPPKFHAGTKRVDEVNATLRTGEAVLSPTGVETAARDVVGRWNSGRSAGGAERPMVVQYRHQVFNQFIRDNLRMSTPLSAAVKTGAAAGFRDRG